MKISNRTTSFLFLLFAFIGSIQAYIFISVQTGDWSQSTTWDQADIPDEDDNIIILSGHIVTINGSAHTHEGNITIRDGGKLIANTGSSDEGFTFAGDEFHVYGELELPTPAKDLVIAGEALFWGHASAVISISDELLPFETGKL